MAVPERVTVSVEILFCRFRASHGLVLVSAHSNLLFQIYQCGLGGMFLIRWVAFLVGFPEFLGFLWWLPFFARGWYLHFIDSHVVGAIGWSFKK